LFQRDWNQATFHVDAREMDDRGDRVEESERILAGGGADAVGEAGAR
jgi:hypothetical protein